MDELVKYLRALVYLQAQQLNNDEPRPKPEILLKNAGLSYKEIADVLGKSEPAVAKAVSRARGPNKKGTSHE